MSLLGTAFRNALRNRFRTMLTILGVALAIVAFVFLQTVLTSWEGAAQYAAQDRIGIRHKLSFVIPLPLRYIDVVREVEGIEAATYANWLGHKDPNRPDEFFSTLAVDPETYLEVYDEMRVDDGAKQRWLEDRRSVIVGDVLGRKLGLDVGDRLTLSGTIFPGVHEYTVAGFYEATRRSVDRSQVLVHWQYHNESHTRDQDRDAIGWIVARIGNSGQAAEISRRIDDTFEQRDVPTISMSERAMQTSFLGMLSAMLTALKWISFIILLILLMILGNTISMGVRERQTEFAVLRAIGFLPRHVLVFILGEALMIGLASGLAGLGLSYPLVELGFGRFVEENMGAYFPYFRIEPRTYAIALGLSVALGMVAAVLPAIRTSRQSVVSALRKVA